LFPAPALDVRESTSRLAVLSINPIPSEALDFLATLPSGVGAKSAP
jgi:hypothetical protein